MIEFNARFGDPETQVLMPRVGGDFAKLLYSAACGALEADVASFAREPCVCVTLATADYPRSSTAVTGLPAKLHLPEGSMAFWGSSTLRGDAVDSPGGRVLTVAATGAHLSEARRKAYEAVSQLSEQIGPVANLSYRGDIAKNV